MLAPPQSAPESAAPSPPVPFSVHELDGPDQPLRPGPALCLSGGGYRAMLFHTGAVWRLYEGGLLHRMERISSVSGGSITAGVLALAWPHLDPNPTNGATAFRDRVVNRVRGLASHTIDIPSILRGVLLPGTVSDRIASTYRKHLFSNATLQDLPGPEAPRFVINASNVQSGALWRFSRPYMRDWRVGEVKNPKVELATAVAASSAFPPVLSPLVLKLRDQDYTPNSGADLQRAPFTTSVTLTDGGVYDNLGVETVWKSFRTILISDGGGKMEAEPQPKINWIEHAIRVMHLLDNQVGSMRVRQVIDSLAGGQRSGAYWGIRTDITHYGLPDAIPFPKARADELAAAPTRLQALDDSVQVGLINWGYAVCDAAIRRHVDQNLPQGRLPL